MYHKILVTLALDHDVSPQTLKIAETLLELGEQYGVTQIYIGRRGESRIHAMIFGSVSAALVQTSVVPVTVVP